MRQKVEVVEDLMAYHYKPITDKLIPVNYPSSENSVDETLLEKYSQVIDRARSFHIWSFEQIGMPDPFPDEEMECDFIPPNSAEDLVYRGDRYTGESPPSLIYFPSRVVYFKLMRACIGVQKYEDLWFVKLKRKGDINSILTSAQLKQMQLELRRMLAASRRAQEAEGEEYRKY